MRKGGSGHRGILAARALKGELNSPWTFLGSPAGDTDSWGTRPETCSQAGSGSVVKSPLLTAA